MVLDLFVVVVPLVQQDTPLFIVVSMPPCLPHPSHTTGRDSLESKVTFIQLGERTFSVECTGDKDFTAVETAPRTARIHPKTLYT